MYPSPKVETSLPKVKTFLKNQSLFRGCNVQLLDKNMDNIELTLISKHKNNFFLKVAIFSKLALFNILKL